MENSAEIDKKTEDLTKKDLPLMQKICLVCGDKALGYNFNAVTCESCKAFFRRNALANKEFRCPFTNNCDITAVTRRFCQKCRLEKCFSVGMVKEFIMSEEDKAEKRKKIQENRAKKRQNVDVEEPVTSSKSFKRDDDNSSGYTPNGTEAGIQYDVLNSTTCSPSSTVRSPLSSELDSPAYGQYHQPNPNFTYHNSYSEDSRYLELYPTEKPVYDQSNLDTYEMEDLGYEKKQNSIKSILTQNDASISFTETAVQQEHVCATEPSTSADPDANKARDILQDVERIEPNSMESILCEAIKLEFEAYTSISSCSGSSRELNEVERAKLNELIVANKALHAPIEDELSNLVGIEQNPTIKGASAGKHAPELINIVNLTAVAIRRLIKMAKKINAFKNMCEEDQVALLKGGCLEMMVLRSTMNYDGQKNTWNIPYNNQSQFESIRTDVLKLAKGNIYQAHDSFIRSFDPKWRTDEHIVLIMSSILLFTPNRSRVVHTDVIKLEQNSYYYLLRRYLESVYPGCEAKSTFLKLIQKILELRKLCELVTGVYLDVNPIEPLLMEIFDLKHHTV